MHLHIPSSSDQHRFPAHGLIAGPRSPTCPSTPSHPQLQRPETSHHGHPGATKPRLLRLTQVCPPYLAPGFFSSSRLSWSRTQKSTLYTPLQFCCPPANSNTGSLCLTCKSLVSPPSTTCWVHRTQHVIYGARPNPSPSTQTPQLCFPKFSNST